jgi:hypothetical protein
MIINLDDYCFNPHYGDGCRFRASETVTRGNISATVTFAIFDLFRTATSFHSVDVKNPFLKALIAVQVSI